MRGQKLLKSHKLRMGQKVSLAPGSALAGSVGGELEIVSLLSVGVNGPEYRVHKSGEPFDRVVAQHEIIGCA